MFIKLFKQLSKKDTSIAGGKGASLGEMTQVGISVPDGFVVLTKSFEEFLKKNNLTSKIENELKKVNIKKPQTIEKISKNIQSLILKAEIPKTISEEIEKEFKKLDAIFVAGDE